MSSITMIRSRGEIVKYPNVTSQLAEVVSAVPLHKGARRAKGGEAMAKEKENQIESHTLAKPYTYTLHRASYHTLHHWLPCTDQESASGSIWPRIRSHEAEQAPDPIQCDPDSSDTLLNDQQARQ